MKQLVATAASCIYKTNGSRRYQSYGSGTCYYHIKNSLLYKRRIRGFTKWHHKLHREDLRMLRKSLMPISQRRRPPKDRWIAPAMLNGTTLMDLGMLMVQNVEAPLAQRHLQVCNCQVGFVHRFHWHRTHVLCQQNWCTKAHLRISFIDIELVLRDVQSHSITSLGEACPSQY